MDATKLTLRLGIYIYIYIYIYSIFTIDFRLFLVNVRLLHLYIYSGIKSFIFGQISMVHLERRYIGLSIFGGNRLNITQKIRKPPENYQTYFFTTIKNRQQN